MSQQAASKDNPVLESLKVKRSLSLNNSPSKTPHGLSPTSSFNYGGRKHRTEPFFIGVAGGTASGKTTVCDQIIQRLHGTVAQGLFCRTICHCVVVGGDE